MRPLKSITVRLSGNGSVYSPGDSVEGEVVLEVVGSVRVQTLTVILRGLARVHWTDSENAGLRLTPYSQHIYSAVEYVRERCEIVSSSTEEEDHVLPEGRHIFPFAITLPVRRLPTSFDGKHGSISYWLRAEVTRTGHTKQFSTKPVTVMNPCALTASVFQNAVERQTEKTMRCGFFKRGRIAVTARMDKSGYSPGDTINVAAEFDNTTSRSGCARLSLYQVQRHCLGSKEKLASIKLASAAESTVKPSSVLSWTCHQLQVPNTTPTIESCSILKVQYFIKVSLRLSGMRHSIKVVLPVTLGSHTAVPCWSQHSRPAAGVTPPPYESVDYSTADTGIPPPPYSCSNSPLSSGADGRGQRIRPPAYSLTANRTTCT